MPEMHFTIEWPNGKQDRCYSPSYIIEEYLGQGEEYPVQEFLQRTRAALNLASERVRERYGSVCSGAFVLAAHGLLDGRRVATHWEGCRVLGELFPSLTVDPEALYVVDDNVWTSAGVTTGIDMALALIARLIDPEMPGTSENLARMMEYEWHTNANEDPFAKIWGLV